MKKLSAISLLFLTTACAQGPIYQGGNQDCNSHIYSTNCPAKKAAPKAVVQKQPQVKMQEKIYVYKEAKPQPQRITLVSHRPDYVMPQPVAVAAPATVTVPATTVSNGCNGCGPVVTQTREPVEIIYKKVTYTTVYEPKTTSTVSYEKEPVINQKIVSNVQTVSQPVAPAMQEVKTVVTTRPGMEKISYTIENNHPTQPNELLIEEIK